MKTMIIVYFLEMVWGCNTIPHLECLAQNLGYSSYSVNGGMVPMSN